MAVTETTVDMDDKELFAAATAPEPVQEEAPQEPAAEEAELRADANGRLHKQDGTYAAKQEAIAEAAPLQQQPAETKAPEAEPAETVGMRQLREAHERAERRAEEARFQTYNLQQQLQERDRKLAELQKPKQDPIDIFTDPDGALKQRLDPYQSQVQTELQEMRRELSEARVIAKFGAPAFEAMQAEINAALSSNDPDMQALRSQVLNSRDPAAVAMNWYQSRKVLKEVGTDPAAYKTKVLEDALKDPAYLAKALEAAKSQANGQPNTRPNIQLPTSLNKASGSGATQSVGGDEDLSEGSLWKHAAAPATRRR